MPSDFDIPLARVAAFLRQHTHDVRNDLNSLDLETALLQELTTDPEAQAGVGRLRKQLRVVAERLRSLSSVFQDPQPMPGLLAAKELLLIWREQHDALRSPPQVEWSDELGDEKVKVDAELMAAVFRELLKNAAEFREGGPAQIRALREGGEVVFELREPKSAAANPAEWTKPFFSTRSGGSGLGLWAARRWVEANAATFTQRYLPTESALLTRIALPVI